MRIWQFVISQRLVDAQNTRTMLLSKALIERGHEVVLWTSAFDHDKKEWRASKLEIPEQRDGLEIRYVRGCGYRKNVSFRRYLDHLMCTRHFTRVCRSVPVADAIIASLPDHNLAYEALRFGKSINIPVMVDIRDPWPDLFANMRRNRFARLMVKTLFSWDSLRTARVIREADVVVAMMNSMLEWGLRKSGRKRLPDDQVFYLSTCEGIDRKSVRELPEASVVKSILERIADSFVVLFVGTFGRVNNPILLVKAIDSINRGLSGQQGRVSFIIGGSGDSFEEVRRLASQHKNVYCTGWLNQTEMDNLVVSADVGIIPCSFASDAFPNEAEIFPNKAFSYLSGGLPIIASVSGDLAQLIETERIGLLFGAGDSKGLAEAVLHLYKERAERDEMANNTRRLFQERFNRERTYHAFASLVEKMACNKKGIAR